ncbi:vascular endothelial growth factor receptor 1 isoform X2 [Megalopta genalis]|uniref:vascular endothelial growth factor receptor 1 isoform X2 n=1 Tax=Megalopta genalis TaxID=115081 RepID=UPI003FCF86C8
MLCRHRLFLFGAVLLSYLCRDSTAITKIRIIYEGSSLTIECFADTDIFFIYPTNRIRDSNTVFSYTSTIEISKSQYENGTYWHRFYRPKTVFGDTGWYGCSTKPFLGTRDDYLDPEIDWTYTYVESKTIRFVELAESHNLETTVGENIVVPCRPTSPTAKVKLKEPPEFSRFAFIRPTFDPQFGFTLHKVDMFRSGLYICTIEPDQEVSYNVAVTREIKIPEPRIVNNSGLQLLNKGETLYLECAVVIPWNEDYHIFWIPMQQSGRITISINKVANVYEDIEKIASLRVTNMTYNDEGIYECRVKGEIHEKNSRTYVQVHGTRVPIITDTNLKKDEINIDVTTGGSETVEFHCFADGMPKPSVTWFKDGTQLVVGNEKYKFSDNSQKLELNHPSEVHSGEYTCRAANRFGKVEASQRITIKGLRIFTVQNILLVVLAVVVLILVIYFAVKIRRDKIMRKELTKAGLMHFEEGAVGSLNPDLTVDDQADLLPYDKKWEFPKEKLKLGKQIGSGAFGVVVKAKAVGICEGEATTTVAVKMVRGAPNIFYTCALASELKIMVHLGKHLNVVNLLGAYTKNILKHELLVIVEFCRFGNLHNYLLKHRSNFVNQIDPTTGILDLSIGLDLLKQTGDVCTTNRVKSVKSSLSVSNNRNSDSDSVHCQAAIKNSLGVGMSADHPVINSDSTQSGWSDCRGDYKDSYLKPIYTEDLLSWAFQVARGMEYLSQRRILHGDLAARNILLADDNVVKICDFGLAKSMYKEEIYEKKSDCPLPIKWLSIETMRDRIFSTQSDIWSFGIVLWEFFTLAETPYPGMETEIVYRKLIEGYRMEQPEYATPEVYDIMCQCWKAEPSLRPSFTDLVNSVGKLLEDNVRTDSTTRPMSK